jgi:hypothetical protein
VITSILTATKKVLGLDESYTAFDEDLIIHINSSFATLNQLGIGPDDGFEIEDATVTWDSFSTDPRMNSVKQYIYLTVRLIFDPPSVAAVLTAFQSRVEELTWRLNVLREGGAWTPPTSSTPDFFRDRD